MYCIVLFSLVFVWLLIISFFFFFSSRRRHTRSLRDWSSDVCSSDLCLLRGPAAGGAAEPERQRREPQPSAATRQARPRGSFLAQSDHQFCSTFASPGPVFGAPTAMSSAPSGPASNPRFVSFGTRTASHCSSSTTSSSSFT